MTVVKHMEGGQAAAEGEGMAEVGEGVTVAAAVDFCASNSSTHARTCIYSATDMSSVAIHRALTRV